ncbi:MAG: hypothetical protein HC824_02070 [Synechococcales cyanobacterium RM1_1_8]|nr:hypothetical protein [Synechococcales cyanobacterium RM1_1_8]
MTNLSFLQQHYPALYRFVMEEEGRIELGLSDHADSFAGAYDLSGTVYQGSANYASLEDALMDLNAGIQAWFEKLGI